MIHNYTKKMAGNLGAVAGIFGATIPITSSLASPCLYKRPQSPYLTQKSVDSKHPYHCRGSLPRVLRMAQQDLSNGSHEVKEPAPKIAKLHHNGDVSESTAAGFFRVKKLSEKAVLPSRGSPLSAGYDLSR